MMDPKNVVFKQTYIRYIGKWYFFFVWIQHCCLNTDSAFDLTSSVIKRLWCNCLSTWLLSYLKLLLMLNFGFVHLAEYVTLTLHLARVKHQINRTNGKPKKKNKKSDVKKQKCYKVVHVYQQISQQISYCMQIQYALV